MSPLVSVITATWQRHAPLFNRCIPSVQAQTYPAIEHIIVSDGPDGELYDFQWRLQKIPVWYDQMDGHSDKPNWGAEVRNRGFCQSRGEFITYCDDDDSLRPEHCAKLVAALLANPDAGFAVSMMASHGPHGVAEIGRGALCCGNVGSPMIMHRAEIMAPYGSWVPGDFEDWDLVLRWLNAGVPHVRVNEITCDSWPSLYREGR